MADIWTFRDVPPQSDLTGYSVEASDGGIGKVDEATHDAGSSWMVVDTGFWIFGKKRMIPAGAIRTVDVAKKVVYLDLTKDQVKDTPDFEEARKNDPAYRQEVEVSYRRWPTWETRQPTIE